MSRLTAIALFFAFVVLAGCGGTGKSPAAPPTKKLTILTSFFPLYVMAQNVAGGIDGVEIVGLAAPSAGCLHDYQLTSADMKKFSAADIFIANGLGAEAFLAKASAANPRLAVITAAANLAPDWLIKDGEQPNPHVWLSIDGAKGEVAAICAELSRLDPYRAASYKANAARYLNELDCLAAEARDALKDISSRDIVTFHAAFPYFARDFRLNVAAVIEREPGSEPGPQEIAATIAVVKNRAVKALCVEPQYPPQTAELIARETGAKIITLDPCVTGEASPAAANAYLAAMRQNIRALAAALK